MSFHDARPIFWLVGKIPVWVVNMGILQFMAPLGSGKCKIWMILPWQYHQGIQCLQQMTPTENSCRVSLRLKSRNLEHFEIYQLSAAILPPITVGNIGWLAILVYIWALLKRSQCHCRPGWVIQFSIAWNKVWTKHKNYQLRWHNLHIVLRSLLGKARCPCGFRK